MIRSTRVKLFLDRDEFAGGIDIFWRITKVEQALNATLVRGGVTGELVTVRESGAEPKNLRDTIARFRGRALDEAISQCEARGIPLHVDSPLLICEGRPPTILFDDDGGHELVWDFAIFKDASR